VLFAALLPPQPAPISPCPGLFDFQGYNPAFRNVDLTATKKFGKWELEAVAYPSTDLWHPIASYQKQSHAAAGGLLGYNLGPLALQVYATTEVFECNYGGRDTRGWFRHDYPLWKPSSQGGCARRNDHRMALIEP
jgi:Putative MetA-pathway of phenol degradation